MIRQPALERTGDSDNPMDCFRWQNSILQADEVPLPAIAEAVGTPTYVYSATAIRLAYASLETAFEPLRPATYFLVSVFCVCVCVCMCR